jgi:hypothetical protein
MSEFRQTSPSSAEKPTTTEYQDFEKWWEQYAKTLNQRATLTWIELAWAGWWARSELAEGKDEPTIYPRQGPSD